MTAIAVISPRPTISGARGRARTTAPSRSAARIVRERSVRRRGGPQQPPVPSSRRWYLAAMPAEAVTDDRLANEVAAIKWYHSIELTPGVVTPGWFDTRAIAPQLPMPADLAGKRCLDVGTYDG